MESESQDCIRDAYDCGGEGYDRVRILNPRGQLLSEHDVGIFQRLLPGFSKGMEVLEVGAGTGRFTLAALEKGYRLTATDINDSQLASLRVKLAESGSAERCQVRVENVFELSFASNEFDLVFCLHVIPRFLTVEDQRDALRELCRVVRPGGRLIFNYRNAHSPYNLLYRRWRRRRQLGYAIKPPRIEAFLRDGEMRIEQLRAKHLLNGTMLDRTPCYLWRSFTAFDRTFERTLPSFAWDVFVLAAKEQS